MQLYLLSHDPDFINTVQTVLHQQQLQEVIHCEALPTVESEAQRWIGAESVDLSVILLTTALSAGGAGTIFFAKLARVLEIWINSKKVEVKIKEGNKLTELSGSAGHIERILKTMMDAKQE
ncbi:hypothetical protein [Beggiatoa leptomitoformis]|uniref:Uncharacterized protein n=1 Tax=Beggiatoa leptomitoformis TaxID=288004 RepID=A0A2N9YD07_9GAMM|nr:hypothetical protein [Beggiatoa leptomitoformis]ALG69206.1 hypothetical protein AL038_17850 [Beggiatoa leptomitoformis]AUI68362.1 hypothetical protein BLE401_06375 [Beggiatoa leptomitoformis]